MSLNSVYGLGKRSIETLQTLISNLTSAAIEAFKIVDNHGIGLRIEVSIRPHFNDKALRHHGHFNDILLLVSSAIDAFCSNLYKPKKESFHARTVRTNTFTLLDEASSMLKFRRNIPFDQVYASDNASEWLRSHLSMVLITMGISPLYGIKYIKGWGDNLSRFDPYIKIPPTDTVIKPRKNMLKTLELCLQQLGFSLKASKTLTKFMRAFSQVGTNPITETTDCYKSLSFREKHLLATFLWSHIIPHLSKFLSTKKGRKNKNRPKREGESDVNVTQLEHADHQCWNELGISSDEILNNQINNAIMPKHPVALAINFLLTMSSLWNPLNPGYDNVLCYFVLECHKTLRYERQLDKKTEELLEQCATGEKSPQQLNSEIYASAFVRQDSGTKELGSIVNVCAKSTIIQIHQAPKWAHVRNFKKRTKS